MSWVRIPIVRHPRVAGRRLGALALSAGLALTAALAAPPAARAAAPPSADALATLRQEIAALKADYEGRISALEQRIAELEAARAAGPAAAPSEADQLAALRAAAAAAAGPAATAPPPPPSATEPVASGHERNLNQANPEISFTGDLVTLASNQQRDDFDARELELNLQSALDPYSFTKWTLSFTPEGGVDVEEGYASYTALPGGLQLTAGKFRQSFGILNRWHQHALPQIDYPLVIRSFFGEEGLDQTGVSLDWLVPHPWAGANEVTLQVTDGENEAFGGTRFRNLATLAHVKNYWDVSHATYLEWGLSGVAGSTAAGGASRVWGTDLTLHWQPPSRAKYSELTWRTELMRSERDDALGRRQDAWGGYSYLEDLVHQNLYAGLRYDRVEDPLDPNHRTWGLFPNLTWWQSEFVRLRGEYGYLKDLRSGKAESRFTLQLTWAAGPHKHDTY